MMAKLTSVLDNKGYRVFSVPEAATTLGLGGVNLDSSMMPWEYGLELQKNLLQM